MSSKTTYQIIPNTNLNLFVAKPLIDDNKRACGVYYEPIIAWWLTTDTPFDAERSIGAQAISLFDGAKEDNWPVIFNRATAEWYDPYCHDGNGEADLIAYWNGEAS